MSFTRMLSGRQSAWTISVDEELLNAEEASGAFFVDERIGVEELLLLGVSRGCLRCRAGLCGRRSVHSSRPSEMRHKNFDLRRNAAGLDGRIGGSSGTPYMSNFS